jgi:hypothetical protein
MPAFTRLTTALYLFLPIYAKVADYRAIERFTSRLYQKYLPNRDAPAIACSSVTVSIRGWRQASTSKARKKDSGKTFRETKMLKKQNPCTSSPSLCQTLNLRNQLLALSPVLLLVAMFAGPLTGGVAHAQNGGEITGTVTDPTGAVVPNVDVKITSVETGSSRATKSNGAGIFDFPGLDNGDYNLTASITGFQAYRKDAIVLNIAETLREDIALAVGTASQEVVVQSNALEVQSESNEVSSLITGQQISQLLTNGRNVTSLASLGTGVSGNLPSFNGVTAQGSNANLSFNGTNPNHNNWLIDGGEVYDRGSGGKLDVLPAPDVIAEFQVLASNYPPDYGINSGALS